jgi:hypothetical protein
MKNLALLTAVLLGSALTQAAACDWDRNASAENRTVVACSGGNCVGQPATQQEPAVPQIADEPTDPTPTTVADGGGNGGGN